MPSAKTVEEMILSLPKQEAAIVKRLRGLVFECLPLATEKPYYGLGVPYYSRRHQICYIFPSSALYGNDDDTHKKNVTLGFCQGNQMFNGNGMLKVEGRKKVRVMYFSKLQEISEDQVRALLFEAGMIDDSFEKRRKGL
jgi:hypothetical protein